MKRWRTLETVDTLEGVLQLRQRGEQEFLITIDGRVLMTSSERRSEQALATKACALIADREAPRVLIGGLGMGYTLRAALEALPASSEVVVAELTPTVEAWCRGPLSPLTDNAVLDPRVRIIIDDVSEVIRAASPGHYDAIMLDLYEGPNVASQSVNDPFYGRAALQRSHAALAKGGVLAVWSEDPDDDFARRFAAAGFETSIHRISGKAHLVYFGRR